MTCKKIQTQLADYSALRLAPSETSDVRRHLESCAACALFYQEEAALARGLESLPLVEPSAELWRRVSAKLDAPEARPSRTRFFGWTRSRRPFAALVTGLAAAAGLAAYTQFNTPSAPVTDTRPVVVRQPVTLPPSPSRDVNPTVDDPMADQMNTLFAAVDQMMSVPANP